MGSYIVMTKDKPAETVEEKVEEIAESKQKVEEVKVEPTASETLRLRKENDEYEAEVNRKQEIRAREALGGRADAGQPEESQEDKDKKEATEILREFQ